MRYLNGQAKLRCIHGGTITPKAPPDDRPFKAGGKPVLVESDILEATVTCSGFPPGAPPCTRVTSILIGRAWDIAVAGEPPLLESLLVITDAGMAMFDPSACPDGVCDAAKTVISGSQGGGNSTSRQEPPANNPDDALAQRPTEDRESVQWAYIRVTERHTGTRVPGVVMRYQMTGRSDWTTIVSNGQGEVRIPAHQSSETFNIASVALEDLIAQSALGWGHFVGGPSAGDSAMKAEPLSEERLEKEREADAPLVVLPDLPSPLFIASLAAHKVKDSDSLSSIAAQYGSDSSLIARYNWDAESAEELNCALYDEVGCVNRDVNTGSYLFSSNDDPGYVFVPGVWRQDNLDGGQVYELKLQLVPAFRFSLDEDTDESPDYDIDRMNPFGGVVYDLRFSNGVERKAQKLSARGRAIHLDPPPGEVMITYTDPIDIRARSLAFRLERLIALAEEEDPPPAAEPSSNRIQLG